MTPTSISLFCCKIFIEGEKMALNLFYITNNLEVALIAEKNGVDRIWIDLETLGKEERQKGINSVKSHHTIEDIRTIKPFLSKSEMLVRVNPWNKNSPQEIDAVIGAGADIVMLPYWKTVEEVQNFLSTVNKRKKTTLLLETKEAVECIDEVLKLDFDEIHIGLNDLHLSYGMAFMFELLSNGMVETLCGKFRKKGFPYGFGGIARLGEGLLSADRIIMEHYRLGSTRAILSRSFCDYRSIESVEEIDRVFSKNMKLLRGFESTLDTTPQEVFLENQLIVKQRIHEIVEKAKG
jgi:2-keto-3-deoxy-L-rhamnonate aldolase RhmA